MLLPDQHQKGNLFTLFLHSPLTAFCYICNIVNIPVAMWDKCQAQIDKFIAEASKLFTRSRSLGKWIAVCVDVSFSNIGLFGTTVLNWELFIKFIIVSDHSFMQFFGDDFLRVLLLRYIFCFVVLRLHRGFEVSPKTLKNGYLVLIIVIFLILWNLIYQSIFIHSVCSILCYIFEPTIKVTCTGLVLFKYCYLIGSKFLSNVISKHAQRGSFGTAESAQDGHGIRIHTGSSGNVPWRDGVIINHNYLSQD